MDKNITIPKQEIAPGVFTTGGTATMPTINPISGQPNVIPTTDLTSQPKINLTGTTPTPTVDASLVANALQGTQTFDTNAEFQRQLDLQKQTQVDQTPLNNILASLTTAEQGLTGRGAEQLTAETQAGLPQAQQQRAGLQGQIKSQVAEYNALKTEFEKMSADIEAGAGRKGLTTGAVMGQQGAVDRAKLARLNSKASEIGLLQAQDLALAGQIETAQDIVNRAIDLKYQDREQEYKIKQAQYDRVKEFLTAEETKRGKALEVALKKEETAIAEAKENEKAIEKMLLDATPNAPASVIANAKAIKDKGGSSLEVAQALGKYGGDYLKTELLKSQIETDKAQRSKYYADIAKTKAETSALGLPGAGKLPTEGQILNAGYADRIRLANDIVASKTDTLKNMNYATFKLLESKSQLANKLLTPDQRQAGQAMRNFITAKLRKESGAAISPTEFDDARLQYFPALGDDEQTLRNKKVLRDSVLNNLIAGSGGAYKTDPIDTYFNAITGSVEAVNNQINNKEKSFLMSLPQ